MKWFANQGVACVFSVASLSALVGWTGIAPTASAQPQVLTVTPAADNTILLNNLAPAFDLSNGKGPIFAGRTAIRADLVQRGLVRFDLSQIPPGSTIVSASVTMYMVRGGSGASNPTVGLYRLLASWGEGESESSGGSGANSLPGDANWHKRFYPDIPWTNEGGDFDATVSSSRGVSRTAGYNTWASTGRMVSDVTGWVNSPATNFGWLIRNNESTRGSARQFVSRESTSVETRPSLRVEYVPCIAPVLSGGASVATCPGGTASFSVTATGAGPYTFAWRKGAGAVTPGPGVSISTSADGMTSTLAFASVGPGDAGRGVDGYSCVVSGPCGPVTSGPFDLLICPADFNCDGSVDFFDYNDFVRCFEGLECAPGKSPDFDEDGTSDFFDYDAFVRAFETPC
ncbi:MAG: DNRLRE domain-containing protein [Planctomycetota bacterium]